jgi:hypothetical protein
VNPTDLSELAVAVLRFQTRGYRQTVNERNLAGFRELAEAGILELVPDSDPPLYRFTPAARDRKLEILAEAEAQLLRREPPLPPYINLSEAARTVLRRYLAGNESVTDANREAFRELARAGIMMSVGTFTMGDDCVFRFTYRGWERRHEFASETWAMA